jgi:predicted DNA-binding transcriptional regulator
MKNKEVINMYYSSNLVANESKNYLQIKREDIPTIFKVDINKIYLRNSRARPFTINFPLNLNEDLAKISAMILDGSISKDLASCTFSQKKDKNKVTEFHSIVKKLFYINGNISQSKDQTYVIAYPKVFASFLYYCLDIHKSDKSARIPKWIWDSHKDVIKEYVRYAFAMEGSVKNPKNGSEVRFHSCDLNYVKDLKLLLKLKFQIDVKLVKYFINDYGWKYYLSFDDTKNVKIFYEQIGFALDSHQNRLKEIVENFKAKAWEMTLVQILSLDIKHFRISDINKKFPYLTKRAVHNRLTDLVKNRFLQLIKKGYILTEDGLEKANVLKNKIKITKLRTNSKDNENKILNFIKKKGKSYNYEISRELSINSTTVRDTLKRLKSKNKIKLTLVDKFQRKFYEIT